MRSKTSCFNKTVYWKNLTRFAPVWGAYLLCLLLGLSVMYMDSAANGKMGYDFANYMAKIIGLMALVNLVYGAVVAQMLFGDLYNSRMCNAMHAMPLRREGWFVTNVVSGLTFSVVPTAIMAGLSIPLLMGTCVHNVWQIGVLWFVGTNLQFLCYFGIGVFCTFCAGNRVAMAALYAVMNFASLVICWVLESLYEPKLYGVVMPDAWAEKLCPFADMYVEDYVKLDGYYELSKRFEGHLEDMVANFTVSEKFYDLIVWGIVGLMLMVIALLLYRKRDVECAGDAAAFPCLKPVMLTLCALGGGTAGLVALELMYGYYEHDSVLAYVFLGLGMVVGWFAGKMFLERNTRVFGPKNWLGLLGIGAAVAVSLVLTSFDVCGFVEWAPKAEEVKSVEMSWYGSDGAVLTEQEDIEAVLRLQELALKDRLDEENGVPVEAIRQDEDGYYYFDHDYISARYEVLAEANERGEEPEMTLYRYSSQVHLVFHMENGRTVTRRYYVWCDGETGEIVKEYMSRWETLGRTGHYTQESELDFSDLDTIRFDGSRIPVALITEQTAEELVAAIQADCRERTMTQEEGFHEGYFTWYDEEYDEKVSSRSLNLYINGGEDSQLGVNVYADSKHTLQWLEEHGLMKWEVHEENLYNG